MNDSRDFQDAASVRSGQTIPRCQSTSVFPTSSRSWWNAKPFSGNAEPQKWAAKYLGHTWYIGKRFFANPTASSSAPCPQESNPWSSNVSEHTSPHVMSESQTPVQDRQPEIHSTPVREDFQRTMGQTNKDCRFQVLIFDKFPTPATFVCWKIRLKTEVCICSQFLTEAVLWIKDVELVDSVDDLKSSCSVRGFQMPNFEVLAAKITSALNRIIHNTHFKRRVSLEEQKSSQRRPPPPRKTDSLPDLRILPGHCGQRFCRDLYRPIYNCSSK